AVALITTMKANFMLIGSRADGQSRDMAANKLASKGGLLALTISYPVFPSLVGLLISVLSGALHGFVQKSAASIGRRLTPSPVFGPVRVRRGQANSSRSRDL